MCSSQTMDKMIAVSHVMKLLEEKWDGCTLVYFLLPCFFLSMTSPVFSFLSMMTMLRTDFCFISYLLALKIIMAE